MPRIIMGRGFIARWTRMPHSTGRLSASASSHHSLSSGAFITNIAESDFRHAQAYVALYLLKSAIERANKLTGGWPEDEAIISQLEGLGMDTPSGYLYMRPDHQAYKDAVTGFSKNLPQYDF